MMKKIGFLLLTIAAGSMAMAQTMAKSINVKPKSYAAEMAKTVMTIWKDSMSMAPGRPVRWSYDQGVVLKGIEGLWKNTGDVTYFNYIQKSMDHFVQEDGTIRTYKPDEYNIDHVLCGRNVLTLYKVTGKQKYLKAVNLLRSQLRSHPRTNEGGFWHKEVYPYQMWLDGLYMGQPFYAEYAATFHEDTAFNDITKQFVLMERNSRDPKTGLLYHGYDESRQQQWADKTTGRSPHVWARALGWYGMAMVDALEWFPVNHPGRDSIIAILNRFAAAITKVQDKNGLWWDIVDLPGKEKNYYEASASSMLVYTLAKGVRNGWLPQKYAANAQKGYDGIIRQFIKVENGQMNLHGTVSVSGLGGKPYRDGSFEYYMSEKVIVNDPKGVGAFLKASNEIEMMPTMKLGAGKTVLLDHYFNGETQKDAFGNNVPFHYIWEEMDNNGYSLFGHVFNKFGAKTKTLYEAPTAQNLKGADLFIIVDPDTKKEKPDPKFIQEKDADALYNWVKAGGVLALFANDSSNTELDHFNILAKKFGFQFNKDFRNKVINNDYPMGTFDVPAGHSIFKTAKNVHLKEICTINAKAPVQAVFTDKGDVIMAVSKVGKGTVFAVGDPWLYNEYTDGRKLPAKYENYKAMEDLVQWLLKQSKK
ncbi:glycoside hydrolase family 88 protein [Chitinophagaceae bacterium LB-8]|uniref:Glycoside hydrolase family 88 protein n=1 Tax=Paraflavisolibacter caeni TaxID=2982496 RepID=A0A9X3BH11_9BACT|nr:glycoside hydrolase family 88 protein [Paraflavisolibacter caeni]MCU7548767.1 glycoside hydrolase family 88 protein [Paraflavisolibacter caeni]